MKVITFTSSLANESMGPILKPRNKNIFSDHKRGQKILAVQENKILNTRPKNKNLKYSLCMRDQLYLKVKIRLRK